METPVTLFVKRLRIVLLIIITVLFSAQARAEIAGYKNIKFLVNVSQLVHDGKFNPAADTIYIKGWFNNWQKTNPMKAEGNSIYSVTIQINENSFTIYKYYISTPGAGNNGMENDYPISWEGSRMLNVGVNDIVLPVVYYNESDMKLARSTAHFNIYCTSQEDAVIDAFAQKMEIKYNLITSALEESIPEKTEIRLYKSLQTFHNATGRPEDPDWAIGSAYGKKMLAMVSPTVVDFNGAIDLLAHEFTHCAEAWKTNVILTNWINEEVATYYAYMVASKSAIKDLITTPAGKPSLESIENDFSNGGYGYAYTIAYFIAKKFGTHALATFLVNMDYTTLGFTDKIAFQTAWHQFLDVYVDQQTMQNVKFSIDMTSQIQANLFKPLTDQVYIRGSFNGWGLSNMLSKESGNIYSVTIPLVQYFFYEYKFYITSAGADNGGWEGNSNETTLGNRLLDLEGRTLILPVAGYNNFTAVTPVAKSNIIIYSENNVLNVSQLPPKSKIQIYQINGSMIKSLDCRDSQISVPIEPGVYILKIGDFARKIIVN